MPQQVDLQEAQRKVFRSVSQEDGLWDVLMGCFLLPFSLAPLLSEPLGDFWSSMVFLPFWGLVALAIWQVRKSLVAPRIGVIRLGAPHKRRLTRLWLVLLAINLVALVLGLIVFWSPALAGQIALPVLGLILLLMFNVAAILLEYPRLHVYGLLGFAAPLVGEWLYREHGISHHGLPLTFGVAAGIMILTGLVVFARLLRSSPLPEQADSSQGM